MIVYKRFVVRRYAYEGSGIVDTVGSLLVRYATKGHVGYSCKGSIAW